MMFFASTRFWVEGWIDKLYLEPTFFFKYYGFEWVQLVPDILVKPLYFILIISALFMALGLMFRWSTGIFILVFSYFELIDATNYLNHHYLVVLFALLLLISPAHRSLSLDVIWRKRPALSKIPRIYIYAIMLQIGVVYSFAGIAKLNPDWLFNAMPLRIWLPNYAHWPIVGSLFTKTWVAFVFAWFGALYDCTIFFWFMKRKTRPFAYATVILFHGLTALFFNIGIFPFLMILSNLIFFGDAFHLRIQSYFNRSSNSSGSIVPFNLKPLKMGLMIYFVLQMIIPLRPLLFTGNTMVTELGYRFGWRVMLLEKSGVITFKIKEEGSEEIFELDHSKYLTPFQEKQMSIQPDFILQLAQHLEKKHAHEIYQPEIYVDSYVAINGRTTHQFINPETNLLAVNSDWSNQDWIIKRKLN